MTDEDNSSTINVAIEICEDILHNIENTPPDLHGSFRKIRRLSHLLAKDNDANYSRIVGYEANLLGGYNIFSITAYNNAHNIIDVIHEFITDEWIRLCGIKRKNIDGVKMNYSDNEKGKGINVGDIINLGQLVLGGDSNIQSQSMEQIDFDGLKNIINRDYKKDDKVVLLQLVDQMREYHKDPSKKSLLEGKFAWLLSRTSEFASISSFILTIMQNMK